MSEAADKMSFACAGYSLEILGCMDQNINLHQSSGDFEDLQPNNYLIVS